MTLSTLLALLAGSEFLATDQVVVVTTSATANGIVGIERISGTQTTLPSGVPSTGPTIVITTG